MGMTEITSTQHQLKSEFLERMVEIEIFTPQLKATIETVNLLLLNDGQDARGLHVQQQLEDLYNAGKLEAVIVVAIHASENRVSEYGVSGVPDFQNRGDRASAYADFIMEELFPYIERIIVQPITGKCAVAGCSLGGLSAFDIAWNHPEKFDLVGVFSGAFWWRLKDLHAGYQEDQDRILHRMIRETKQERRLRFWLMTGTADELADRNRNFIIDAIDDTIDVIKELEQKGLKRPDDIAYYEVVGGTHDVPTWAAAFPAFLTWAFSRKLPGH